MGKLGFHHYSPASLGPLKSPGRYLDLPAVFGNEFCLSHNHIDFQNLPDGSVIADLAAFRGNEPALLMVKAVFVCKTAEKPSAGTGDFHGIEG